MAKLTRWQRLVASVTGSNELDLLLQYDPDLCRERLLSDLVNTGVVATLLTGFSYDTWVTINEPPTRPIEIAKDVITYITIQATMFSAIMATFLYKKVSACNGVQAQAFLRSQRHCLMGPHIAFIVGAVSFLVMVLLFGYMSTDKVVLRIVYISMGVGCPMFIGVFFISSSSVRPFDPHRRKSLAKRRTSLKSSKSPKKSLRKTPSPDDIV